MKALKHTGPLLGYNNNVPHEGQMFHVQTEDSGTKRPHVITHLFRDGGRVVKTTKTSYAHFLANENVTERVRALMRDQHKAMVIQLRDGLLDHLIAEGRAEIEEKEAPRSIPPPPLSTTGETPASAPLELLERAAAVNEREFHQEMERLAVEALPPASLSSRPTPPPGGAGTYSFVGRSGAPHQSGPPKHSSPPSSKRPTTRRMVGTRPGTESKGTPMPADSSPPRPGSAPPDAERGSRKFRSDKQLASDSDRPTNVYARRVGEGGRTMPDLTVVQQHSEATGTFGQRFKSERRFDEVVSTFLTRRS